VSPSLGVIGNLVGKSEGADLVNDGSQGPKNLSEEIPGKLPCRLEGTGSLPMYMASLPCVVIGEGWPTWLPILPS
jgi:hypothetical protein